MNEQKIGHLSSEQLLFLSPWRPVETDTTPLEGQEWECPNCAQPRSYFRSLARLEGGKQQFMIQCPTCDHLVVVDMQIDDSSRVTPVFGGPHIDQFLSFLDKRSKEGE